MSYTQILWIIKEKMFPVALLEIYLNHCNNLDHNSDNSYVFPNGGAKFAQVLPIHLVQIQIPITHISHDNYRKSLKNHLDFDKFWDMV